MAKNHRFNFRFSVSLSVFLAASLITGIAEAGQGYENPQEQKLVGLPNAFTPCVRARGIWIWNSGDMLRKPAMQDQLIDQSRAAKITDVYLYAVAKDYTRLEKEMRAFNAKVNKAGIRVWGMDGYRGYFSDAFGPSALYAAADGLIAFNARVPASERFVGFQTDMEPQDGQGAEFLSTFHNGIRDSALDRTKGGVWQATQALDREMLMRDWLEIHRTLKLKVRKYGLKLGGAMPSWPDDYYGEEVRVTFDGFRQGVMKHMMGILDEYIIMSYNTNPSNVANRILGEISYADTIPADNRPRVYGALETYPGVGSGISYADTPGKNSKSVVLSDIQIIEAILGDHPSYCGISLHDWTGWSSLRP